MGKRGEGWFADATKSILARLGALPNSPTVEWQKNEAEKRVYPWEGDFDPTLANSKESGIGEPNPVGAFANGRSPYGCEEMAGNVWEWTRSHWGAYPYQLDGKRESLTAGNDVTRVIRGGSYYQKESQARCSVRYGASRTSTTGTSGFVFRSPCWFLSSGLCPLCPLFLWGGCGGVPHKNN